MSENPFQAIFLTLEKISHGVQTPLSQFAGLSNHQSSPPTNGRRPLFSLASSFNPNPLNASSNSSVLLPEELTNEVSSVLSSPSRYSNWVNLKISWFCVSGNWVYGGNEIKPSFCLTEVLNGDYESLTFLLKVSNGQGWHGHGTKVGQARHDMVLDEHGTWHNKY